MTLFSFSRDDVVTPYSLVPSDGGLAQESVSGGNIYGNQSPVALAADRGTVLKPAEQLDQFFVFQLSNQAEGPTILESSQAESTLMGSAEQEPDVLVSMKMESFHLAADEDVDPNTRATLRVTCGKDESSTDSRFDTLFWSVAAGLKLYEQFKTPNATLKNTKADFRKAFGNRPIEVPGGLARLSFEVVKHKEPAWWQRIFTFLQSDTAESLISVLGFPAITLQAISVIDELLNRLVDSEPKVLFKSVPMRLALSKWARNEYTGGNPRIKIGCLNPGFCVLARGRDFDTIARSNAIYMPTYDRLVPADVGQGDLVGGTYDDPFKHVTYAVFRVGMKPTKLDPTFNFGG